MAKFIPSTGPMQPIPSPLTLTAIRKQVGEQFNFVELPSDDILVVGVNASDPNQTATSLAGQPIAGPAILCSPTEIA